jgi:hypothetical protein
MITVKGMIQQENHNYGEETYAVTLVKGTCQLQLLDGNGL